MAVDASDQDAALYREVRGLSRGLAVLRALNARPGGIGGVADLARTTGLHRTTVKRLLEAADNIERERLEYARMSSEVTQSRLPKNLPTRITPLPDQKVVVLIGTEEGIAGIESFI